MYFARKCLLALAMVGSLLLPACKTTAHLDAPAGFAKLASGDEYDVRSVSAHGVVVAARTESNELGGNTDFWADALDVRLERAGYTREAAANFDARSGSGKMQRYTVVRDGRTMRYWVLVISSPKRVVVVEAGGDKDAFDPVVADVERAMKSVAVN
jgi:hypothetical protein